MLPWDLIADAVLVVLLVATLLHVARLSRRLSELRKDREAFESLIAGFAKATADAQRGVADLRQGAEGIGRDLSQRIERGQGVVGELQHSTDDLKMLINRAEAAAGKLEAAIGESRRAAPQQGAAQPGVPARGREPHPHQPDEADAAGTPEDAQTRALLSALGRIR